MNEQVIRKYMRKELQYNPGFFDIYNSLEVNPTKLAEDAAEANNLYIKDKIPEWVFEIALEVAEERDWFFPVNRL